MRLARVVVRFPIHERAALDRLRVRYFAETRRGLSRASIVRILVRRSLDGADDRPAADVLRDPGTAVLRSVPMPPASPDDPAR